MLDPKSNDKTPDLISEQLFQARIKSNEVLQEHLKQIIAVASGALILTITFLKEIVSQDGHYKQLEAKELLSRLK